MTPALRIAVEDDQEPAASVQVAEAPEVPTPTPVLTEAQATALLNRQRDAYERIIRDMGGRLQAANEEIRRSHAEVAELRALLARRRRRGGRGKGRRL